MEAGIARLETPQPSKTAKIRPVLMQHIDKPKRLFDGERIRRFQAFEEQARDKLELLDASISLQVLAVIPGNRLESLRGDRKGQWSIRINKQWRICFKWEDGDSLDVEIVDYHS